MNALVPIDFSNHSKTAAEYAASLVQQSGGHLHLIHVIVPIQEEPEYITADTLNAKMNTVYEMFQLQELLRRKYGVRTSCDMYVGVITDEIFKAAKRSKTDLIVMGTQGNNGLRKFLYGSHTAEVIEHSPVPVLTLPEGIPFKPFKRFVYATDYNYSNINDIKQLAAFAKPFDALISLIHVAGSSADKYKREDFMELIKNEIAYNNISLDERINTDAADGLRTYLKQENADLLIVPQSRNRLVKKISGRYADDDFQFDLEIPLLVF